MFEYITCVGIGMTDNMWFLSFCNECGVTTLMIWTDFGGITVFPLEKTLLSLVNVISDLLKFIIIFVASKNGVPNIISCLILFTTKHGTVI